MMKLRSSSELPDDEGTVFITVVPDAPFQVLGRRWHGGLFVGSVIKRSPDRDWEELREIPENIEFVEGKEAKQLLASVAAALAMRSTH
jgi:hypothetical protein